MIEKLFRFCTRLRLATQANAFFNCAINDLFFRRGFENLVECLVRSLLIDLFQPKIALQSLSSNWPLLDTQRGVTMRKPRIIQIAIFAQPLDNRLYDILSRATTFEQALSQFFDRAWFSGE